MKGKELFRFLAAALICSACQCRQSCVEVVDQTYIHKYGLEVPPQEWNQRGQQGSVVTTRADGVVVETQYSHGILQGDTTYTYPHSSQIKRRETYEQGQLVKDVSYSYAGFPLRELKFYPGTSQRQISVWYEDGSPKSVELYNGNFLTEGSYYPPHQSPDGIVKNSEGVRRERDDFGILVATETISRGLVTERLTYYPNGSPQESATFKNGEVDGSRKLFSPGGDPVAVEQWQNGAQHGVTTLFNNGEKIAEVPYENGMRSGIERQYRDGSIVVKEVTWQSDQQHGPCTSYFGNKAVAEWYYQGAPVSKAKYDLLSSRKE